MAVWLRKQAGSNPALRRSSRGENWRTLNARSALLRVSSKRRRLNSYAAIAAALVTLLAVFAVGNYSADAHPFVHPQKKLFSGRWYKSSADLTASPPWFGTAFPNASYPCDGGYDAPSCVSKWQGPAYASFSDWDNPPDHARVHMH